MRLLLMNRGYGRVPGEEAYGKEATPMVGRPLMRIRKIAAGCVVCGAMLFAAPSAFAVSAAQSGYSFPAGSVQQQLGQTSNSTPPPEGAESSSSGTEAAATTHEASSKLPFTGLDIGLVVGAGGVLLAMGFGIRRLSRSPSA